MERRLRFHPDARADLARQHDWIAREANEARAAGYLSRIRDACEALSRFPLMGRADDDLGLGLRVLGFERRAAIVYRVGETTIDILAVYHGGRDMRALGER